MLSRRIRSLLLPVIYLSAGYQFVRYYVSFPVFYLNLGAYLSGRERLPFQCRVLPIFLLSPLIHSRLVQRIAAGRYGPLHNPNRLAFFIVSLVAFAFVNFFCMKLYGVLSPTRRLSFLVFPVLLFSLIWTFVIHIEGNFSYPYDLISLAFFTAGLYFIYGRRFLPLVVVMILGTLNRETTLFLIGIYILDAASVDTASPAAQFRSRFNESQISWPRVLLLSAIWIGIKFSLSHLFAGNDRSEDFNRFHENLVRVVTPYYWPVFLNICGYLIPFVWIFRSRIRPQRFANYLYILAPWVAVMFVSGVLVETRIYGELCTFAAIAIVLIFEQYIGDAGKPLIAGQTTATEVERTAPAGI